MAMAVVQLWLSYSYHTLYLCLCELRIKYCWQVLQANEHRARSYDSANRGGSCGDPSIDYHVGINHFLCSFICSFLFAIMVLQ